MKAKFKDMPKTYSPKEFETDTYNRWMESGCFTAKVDNRTVAHGTCLGRYRSRYNYEI